MNRRILPFPHLRQELPQPADRRLADLGQHAPQVALRVDPMRLSAGDQAPQHRVVLSEGVIPRKKPVAPADRHPLQRPFGRVVVDVQESPRRRGSLRAGSASPRRASSAALPEASLAASAARTPPAAAAVRRCGPASSAGHRRPGQFPGRLRAASPGHQRPPGRRLGLAGGRGGRPDRPGDGVGRC
jgi:hypothetical protein